MSGAEENRAPLDDAANGAVHAAAVSDSVREASSTGLPFLVTHWLANYSEPHRAERDGRSDEALQKLRRAASEIASAFSELGAFGTSGLRAASSGPSMRNASYSDVARSWGEVRPQQLELLAESAASTSVATREAAQQLGPPQDLIQAAYEASHNTVTSGGRRLKDGRADEADETTTEPMAPTALSVLEPPPLLMRATGARVSEVKSRRDSEKQLESCRELRIAIASDAVRVGSILSKRDRKLQEEYDRRQASQNELKDIETIIERQNTMKMGLLRELQEQCDALQNLRSTTSPTDSAFMEQTNRIEGTRTRLHTCERVIDQMDQKRSSLVTFSGKPSSIVGSSDAATENQRLAAVLTRYGDPFQTRAGQSLVSCLASQRHSLLADSARQYGVRGPMRLCGRVPGVIPKRGSTSTKLRALISRRMSHAITVSAHLSFPVFCAKFDRTGRYFVTGSDDGLVKLFCLGVGKSKVVRTKPDGSRHLRFAYGANEQSAVLVCTLRGHAGVICDLDVNSDNSFLATASGDGDCRIWGLKDGCPIAILRGHVGGANMVSWSDLTPFRLVTAGDDGLCRMWDIREAALKRYGAYIGKRKEYTLPAAGFPTAFVPNIDEMSARNASADDAMVESVMLPPLPPREQESIEEIQPPPLPPPEHRNGALHESNPNNEDDQEELRLGSNESVQGVFVANDEIDEGVWLLAKMHHGETPDENAGAGTRSRRKGVRVICLARCPLGGHFVTGSDDGVCRVWLDSDDDRVERADARPTYHSQLHKRQSSRSGQLPSQGRKLADLAGHMNPITDLHYSHAGDRILSASQKDGVARVWSWVSNGSDSCSFSDPRQVVLRLPRPKSVSRRETNATTQPGSAVVCDVAVWTADDSSILTSQCCPLKPTSTEIVPGTQYIFVWDSATGHCLLGISGAHVAQCTVIVPHPDESSIFCSAGADGVVKLWDVARAECLLSHTNKVEFALTDRGDKGQTSGYLEGCFSPDGLVLILTDDNGRLTLLTGLSQRGGLPYAGGDAGQSLSSSRYTWLNEQYFASDYYDLIYDTNGYCVEKGSGKPPHLAPRAARCSHSGSSWTGEIDEVYKNLEGPLPLDNDTCRWTRESIRASRKSIRNKGGWQLACSGEPRLSRIGEFDPERTLLISGTGDELHGFLTVPPDSTVPGPSPIQTSASRATSGRTLSSNFNWIDFDDVRDDDGMQDADDSDEDFAPRSRAVTSYDEESDSDASELDSPGDTERSRRRRRRGQERGRVISSENHPTRMSERSSRQTSRYEVPDSDEDMEEYEAVISTNTTPSGPHVEDYFAGGHFYRLPDGARVLRKWLRRTQSSKSYRGLQSFVPQVGDSVVYIPQAHRETLGCFAVLETPWIDWPSSLKWPVLRCIVKSMRYRFPFKSCFSTRDQRTRCQSIVAILTLEITGIPELSNDRGLPWLKPRFHGVRHTRAGSQEFEVHLFENECVDFLIFENLFISRIETLEERYHQQNDSIDGLRVVNYSPATGSFQGREDADYSAYRGTLRRLESSSSSDRFVGSGLDSIRIEWDDSSWGIGSTSPWEISVLEVGSDFDPPCLASGEKQAVEIALKTMRENSSVQALFNHRVNEAHFSDYARMVEVPMYFSLIEERFKADYYSNPKSVVADVCLIRDNCIKYNGVDSDVSVEAQKMAADFNAHLTSELQRVASSQNDVDQPEEQPADSRSLSRISRRTRGSSLESLPEPHGMGMRVVGQANNREAGVSRSRTRAATPSLARTGSARNAGLEHDDGNGEDTPGAPSLTDAEMAPGSTLRSTRTTGARYRKSTYTEESDHGSDFSEEESESADAPMMTRRSLARSAQSQYSARSCRSAASRRRQTHPSLQLANSSDEDEDEEMYATSEASEEELPPPPHTLKRQSPRQRGNIAIEETDATSPQRRSLRSRPAKSMADLSNSEGDGEEPLSDEEHVASVSRKRRSIGRQANGAKKVRPWIVDQGQLELPNLEPWPTISLSQITRVGQAVMDSMSLLDINKTFAIPVVEACPHIAGVYRKAIKHPMDFRTITEDKIPVYQHINELQDDLISVFKNCVNFNGPETALHAEAIAYWAQINDVFRNACEVCKVRLRGWKG